jgi:formamidopyrimidine-DNA glycosylase
MPELPEVETIRLGLQKYLVGHKIVSVVARVSKLFVGSARQVVGAKITGLKRIGKGLIIELDNDYVLAVHLKMTGQLIYSDSKTKNILLSVKVGGATLPSKYSHVIFTLDNGAFLYYNDLRQFGWVKVLKKDEVMQVPFFKEMGPEPLKDLTLEKFRKIILDSNLAVKVLLMDQKKIGGIGNIYANDALFEARIDPRRKAKTLSTGEIEILYKSILKILQKALDYGGSSDENFVNALGQEGNYQKHALVYGREGERCRGCDGIVQKIKLGGRGTFFCSCQK